MNNRPQQPPPVTKSRRRRGLGPTSGKPHSLPIPEWPASDCLGWTEACRPAQRLKRGGAAGHLAPVSQADIANRYGLYLNFLQRNGWLDPAKDASTLVAADNVKGFIAELQVRVRPITVWNSVYKLRRAAQLIAPGTDFEWLTEIEKDVALVMVPRSKANRLVLTERLVEAGLTLIREAEMFGKTALARAIGVRNGLLIALLALHHRPVLCRGDAEQLALWVSSTTGRQLTAKNLGTLISKITREAIGVDVSPHLFRTAGASTAAVYGGDHPHLASALLSHHDPGVTEEHYNRAMSISAGEEYGIIARFYRQHAPGT